ncbi:unnamed protein product [Ceutorhynchus assimilis]|uniref:Uncharacterized protein n=1 Tax=Ceutorhynchus assimilis TaxID=467358 RepID=A0A9N9QS96_9CUCU|nr:unnamed protein product [Ceutorhynchus assimilis]
MISRINILRQIYKSWAYKQNHSKRNLRSKKLFRNVEIQSYTELSPSTPEDPFHASSGEDSLFCPGSDEESCSDDDVTPKKPGKLGRNRNPIRGKISTENINAVASTVESDRAEDSDYDLNLPSTSRSTNLVATNSLDRVEDIDHDLNLPRKSGCTKLIATKAPYKRKPDHCYYCETKVLNFSRHVLRNHSNENDVAKILAKPIKSRERKKLFNLLRRKGNFLADGGDCFKPVREGYVPERDKLPCDNCLGHFSSKLLYRHKKKCKQGNAGDSENVKQLKMFYNGKVDRRLKEEVFPHMRADKLSLEAQKDPLICEYGARYLKTHREKHFIYVTSRKMRELSKILLEMRKLEPSITTFISALKPNYFDIFVEATKRIAKYDSEQDVYFSPTFAMNIVRSLKQCCDIAITFIYTKNVAHTLSAAGIEADLKTLIRLFETNWSCEVSSQAANNLNLNKWNKVTIVPLASDLRLLRQHLIKLAGDSLQVLIKEVESAKVMQVDDTEHKLNMKNPKTIQAFNILMETIYCRVILLNRKRSGELQRMYLHTYLNASTETQKYEEFDNAVSLTEKVLLKSLKRVVIRGKRGRGVPVLFHSDIQDHIKKVLEVRDHFVPKNNPYLFAMANSDSHLIGYKVLPKHAKLCGAQNPSSITSTRLRKHLATLSQLFNLSDGEIEQLATFMGHTSGVHKNSYRLPDDVYQTAKISKLLMVMEKGGADHYKGKSIDEIDIDMEENLLGDKECDDNSDDDEDENPIIDELLDTSKPSTSRCQDIASSNEIDEESATTIKKRKNRKLVPWTDEQKTVTLDYFKEHIELKKPPKRLECEDLKSKYKQVLSNKDWLKIKVFIQNVYTKKKK